MGLLQDKLSKFRLPQLYMERGVKNFLLDENGVIFAKDVTVSELSSYCLLYTSDVVEVRYSNLLMENELSPYRVGDNAPSSLGWNSYVL